MAFIATLFLLYAANNNTDNARIT